MQNTRSDCRGALSLEEIPAPGHHSDHAKIKAQEVKRYSRELVQTTGLLRK